MAIIRNIFSASVTALGIGKCGKAASLRAAFPEECGYAAEEMDGKSLDDLNDGTVLNGTASRINEVNGVVETSASFTASPRVLDLSMISPRVQKAVTELVRRTAMAGAWKAAYDYANNKFSGLDLTYAITELDKAAQAVNAASNSFDAGLQPTDDSSMPPMSTPAADALNKARETLDSLR